MRGCGRVRPAACRLLAADRRLGWNHAAADAPAPCSQSASTSASASTSGGSVDCCDQPHRAPTPPPLWNQLPPAPLRHQYFALRHGQSLANVEGVISSDPALATVAHGLSQLGRAQASEAAAALTDGGGGWPELTHVAVYSSDFTRAWETAELFCAKLRAGWRGSDAGRVVVAGPTGETRLRERWFGHYDGTPDSPQAEGSLGGYPVVRSSPGLW
jgi:hypothetical protein